MTTTDELHRLLERAMADGQDEPAFFRALLEATVYAHVPLSYQNAHLQFMQFKRPDDGLLVLPFFTDEVAAGDAAQSVARVVAMTGRQLMEATQGATLVLNPMGRHCTLYPEEIEGLLSSGITAVINDVEVQEETAPLVGQPEATPAWLVDTVTTTLAKLPFVSVAYLAGLRKSEAASESGLLIVLGGESPHAERAVRAVTAAIQALCQQHRQSVDLAHFDARAEVPRWIADIKLEPFYRKAWGTRLLDMKGSESQH